MIVVVEGPSAAGKTTWCQRHAGEAFVPEYVPRRREPDGADPGAPSDFWVSVNADRWRAAQTLEREHGAAVCDSDPLKLHYSWCLARIGADSVARWESELRATRRAFEAGRLGFADLVLVDIPGVETLRARRDGDRSRRRRTFDLHSRLGDPLREWYEAVARIDPERVLWHFPGDGVPPEISPRSERSDPALLDALVQSLPALGAAPVSRRRGRR